MSSSEMASWVGAIGQIVAAFSLIFLWYQMQQTKQQLLMNKNMHDAQQLYETFRFLMEIRSEIEDVMRLDGVPVDKWSDNDRKSAIAVCSRFNIIGTLIRENMVPGGPVMRCWYYSIPACYSSLDEFISEVRKERGDGYWSSFEDLKNAVVENSHRIS